MNCKVEETKNANEVKLEITVEAEKFDEAIKKVYFKSAKYFNIPGFRKGRAPMNIVEKHYGSEIFYEDTFIPGHWNTPCKIPSQRRSLPASSNQYSLSIGRIS